MGASIRTPLSPVQLQLILLITWLPGVEHACCNGRTALRFSPRADTRLSRPISTPDSFLLAAMASPYPGTIALDSGTNRPIRGQYPSLINALRNPQLSVDGERPPVPEESGPSTEASDVPPDPSVQSLRDLAIVSPDVASQEQDTARATKGTATSDGKSDSRSGSLCLLTDDKASKGTARPVHTEHDLVHMAPWVEDSLHNLKKN